MMQHYGKYRGTVVDDVDPQQMGRLQVSVPDVGLAGAWAMPCFPVAGDQAGAWMIPGPGTGVWVEFEQGDVDNPIWSGCWYASAAEVPPLALQASPTTPPIVLQTRGQTTVIACPHGGKASPVSVNNRVTVEGVPALLVSDSFPVTGCPFEPQPCTDIIWSAPASRVLVNGRPVLLSTSTGQCLSAEHDPRGPSTTSGVQARVIAL